MMESDTGSLERCWLSKIDATGHRLLSAHGDWIDAADPDESVSPRSRRLCAGLGVLGLACYRALGGRRHEEEVLQACAVLSWLTKLDDQVIDDLPFHGGANRSPIQLRWKVRTYLEPTLQAIIEPSTARDEPRCRLAARLGRMLRELDPSEGGRREALIRFIAEGWRIQVDAVERLTRAPEEVSAAAIKRTTSEISGAWLLMISAVGMVPGDAVRRLTPAEKNAFYGWGLHIQRADALADLEKDLAEGLIATEVCHRLWWRDPVLYRLFRETGDVDAVYRGVFEEGIDEELLPAAEALEVLDAALWELGDVTVILRAIHGFLLTRYLLHPRSRRNVQDSVFHPFVALDGASTALFGIPKHQEMETCSAR